MAMEGDDLDDMRSMKRAKLSASLEDDQARPISMKFHEVP